MRHTATLRLPIKPVPFQKKATSKRHPPWSYKDVKPKIDFRWHPTPLDANVYLFRKTLGMSAEDKFGLVAYVDCLPLRWTFARCTETVRRGTKISSTS